MRLKSIEVLFQLTGYSIKLLEQAGNSKANVRLRVLHELTQLHHEENIFAGPRGQIQPDVMVHSC